MKLICMLCIAFVLGTVPTVAWADDPPANYEPVYIPKCDIYTLSGGKEICGFEVAVWFGEVLTVDAELVHEKKRLKSEQARSAELSLQVNVLQGQIDVHAETQKLLLERDAETTKQLIAKDKELQNERVKPRWGNPLAWTAAAVATAILAGFVIKGVVD